MLYNWKLWKDRFTVVIDTDGGIPLASYFRLQWDGAKVIIVEGDIKSRNIDFDTAVTFREFIAIMVPYSGSKLNCQLQLYDELF